MAFTWGQESRAEQVGYNKAKAELAQRELDVIAKEIENKKVSTSLDLRKEWIDAANKQHDDIEVLTNQAKFNLTTAHFEIEKHNFELEKTALAKDKAQLQITLDQAKANYEAKVEVALMEQSVEHDKATTELYTRVAKAEAKVDAKDLVIASKDGEILRLDELLKVTMGKLTQIDVKGLTIHVENSKEVKKEDKDRN